MYCTLRNSVLGFVFLLGFAGIAQAQTEPPKEKPNQLNIIKLNVTQLLVNEARLLYELEMGKTTSLEFGAGYIYRNGFWYDRGGSTMLGSGFGVYAGARKYFDKKRYIYQPFLRSYSSVMLFARRSSFENEWLLFGDAQYGYQTELFSQVNYQYGGVVRFGWQTRAGRVVLDFYTGLGMKVAPSLTTSHALNDSSQVLGPIPTTEYREISSRNSEVEVVLNAGIQLGIRQNNKVRDYKERPKREEEAPFQETPPKF